MGTVATKRALPHKGYVIRRDCTRAPVLITPQGAEYVWVTVNTPTRLPGGRVLKAGLPVARACTDKRRMMRPNPSTQPRPEPRGPRDASDAEIESAIRARAPTGRDWALSWAVLQVARAIERSWGVK
jgi:hypothetical protein